MNTASNTIPFEKYRRTDRQTSSFRLAPQPVEMDDPIENNDDALFLPLDETPKSLDAKRPLPGNHPLVLGAESMRVPSSLMRRIEHELREDECDLRTTFSACRGLVKGTSEFTDAYVTARIRNHSRLQRDSTHFILNGQGTAKNSEPLLQQVNQTAFQETSVHPMVVMHLGHLMRHFGIYVMALFGTQVLAAWKMSAFLNEYLMGGRPFYLMLLLGFMMATNARIWVLHRGKVSRAFYAPGVALFLLSLLLIIAMNLRQALTFAEQMAY
ncbi:MAG: hypothetical protein H8M99_10370 [Gloeobacteraceae cyanobacterium ES-bin-144]|nr:hypothetical protein [Verrucomicrobiales bacterium]